MTFTERYQQETTWHGRAMVMEIYHLAMSQITRVWTIRGTAQHFNVSVGLVSENLKLAHAIHIDESILQCESRQEALKRLNGRSV
jgi:hypothetical protein